MPSRGGFRTAPGMVMELPNYFINLHQSAPTGKCHHIFRFHYKLHQTAPTGVVITCLILNFMMPRLRGLGRRGRNASPTAIVLYLNSALKTKGIGNRFPHGVSIIVIVSSIRAFLSNCTRPLGQVTLTLCTVVASPSPKCRVCALSEA